MKQAIQRGVRVRILAQVMDHSNETMFKSWIKLGIQVRASHLVETRIIIFDSQTVYLSSFNPSKRASGLGVRFSYQPIAILAKSIFFEQWERAKLI
jgi:phosphatidylserine/phosphatidylglycerophosphate/cardiolipin synthase-like enzyme